jgi:shikimate kinase
MARERSAAYEQISDIIVDVDERTPEQIVDEIVDHLASKGVDRPGQVTGEDE